MSVTASWISSGNSGNPAASAASARRTVDTVITAVPCLLRGVLGRSPGDLPAGRHQVRDRHPKFYEDRDNLGSGPGRCRDRRSGGGGGGRGERPPAGGGSV